MNRRPWLALICGALVAVLAGRMGLRYLDWQASEAQRAAPAARSEVKRLQALAEDACRCARRAGEAGEAACWQDFKAVAPGPPIGGDATACAPVSTETRCFATAAGEACIIGYTANGASDPALVKALCTADEARAVEQAAEQGWLGPDGKPPDPADQADWDASNKRANAAIDRVLRQIVSGAQVAAAPSSGGCVG